MRHMERNSIIYFYYLFKLIFDLTSAIYLSALNNSNTSRGTQPTMLSSTTASPSTLPAPALAASRAALNAAFADQQSAEPVNPEADEDGLTAENGNGDEQSLEPGEIQEVNMEAQAEGIRTVFSDPTNFNVKASHSSLYRTEVRRCLPIL